MAELDGSGAKPKFNKISGDLFPLPNDILVHKMDDGQRTYGKSGIIIAADTRNDTGIRPRWCQIYRIGKNIDYVKEGEWILLSHGRWTYGWIVDHDDGTQSYVQKIDTKEILLVSEEEPKDKYTK